MYFYILNRISYLLNLVILTLFYKSNVTFGASFRVGKGFKLDLLNKHCRISFGKKFNARDFLYICCDGGIIEIGDNVFFNNFCSINSQKGILIGDNCIFGENVRLYDHNHYYKTRNIPILKQGFSKGEIIIGNNCWIGSGVTILKGVHIGDNSIIGANSVVYKNIPANSIYKNDDSINKIQYDDIS